MIAKTKNNYIFGGFTRAKLEKNKSEIADPHAFVFSLNTKQYFKTKEPKYSLCFEVTLTPDSDSIYENGVFHIIVKIPEDYPYVPPTCFMKTKIYHPNINENNGYICLNTLKQKDNWNPTMTLERLLLSILMLLDLPNTQDFLDFDKAKHYDDNFDDFVKTAKDYVQKYAKE